MSVGKFFIGGLARETTSTSLRAYFEQFGELSDAVVMMKDGRPRGFGFVTFANPAMIPATFASTAHVIDGKQVDVKSAVPEAESRTAAGVRKLFLGGLSPGVTKDMLLAHFGQFGTITDAVVMEQDGKPRGFGFVTYDSAEMANTACRFSPHTLDGKVVDVKKAEPKGSPGLQQQQMGMYGGYGGYGGKGMGMGMGMGGMGLGKWSAPGPMRAQPPRTEAAPAASPYGTTDRPHSPNAKVFVGGLARNSTEDSLGAYFANFGSVVGCEVMRRDGVSRGFAFVVFSSDQEAAMALAHPQHMIDGKAVEVKTCQPKEAMVSPQAGAYGMMAAPPPGMYAAPGMGMPGMAMGMGMPGMAMPGMGGRYRPY